MVMFMRVTLLLLNVHALHAQVVIIDDNYGLLNRTMTCKFRTTETIYHRSDGRKYVLNPTYTARHTVVGLLDYLYNMAQRQAINERFAALCLNDVPDLVVTLGGSVVASPCEYCYTEEGLERAVMHERTVRGGAHMNVLVFLLPFVFLFGCVRMCRACWATYKLYARRHKASKDTTGAIGVDVRTDSGEISE